MRGETTHAFPMGGLSPDRSKNWLPPLRFGITGHQRRQYTATMKYTLLTLAALSGTAFAQSITNGSMNAPAGIDTSITNSIPPIDWMVESPSPDTIDTSADSGLSFASSSNGGTFAGSAASPGNSYFEGISQDISGLTIGQSYDITFEQSITRLSKTQPAPGYWAVTFGSQTLNSNTMAVPAQGTIFAWQDQTLTFTASATTQKLIFMADSPSNTPGDMTYVALDGVSITPVPEPSSTALLGLGSLALILRRRK